MDPKTAPSQVRRGNDYRRLDEQIRWYDAKAITCQRFYKRARVTVIVAAALIPVISFLPADAPDFWVNYPWPAAGALTALLGALIVVVESLLQLNGWHKNWLAYRQTCERLRVEQSRYIHYVAPYDEPDAKALKRLVDRSETIMSAERNDWFERQETDASQASTGGQT